jgi:hypothetical protein
MQSGIVRAVSRLLVVEDHPATRAGLVACLEAQPDLASAPEFPKPAGPPQNISGTFRNPSHSFVNQSISHFS